MFYIIQMLIYSYLLFYNLKVLYNAIKWMEGGSIIEKRFKITLKTKIVVFTTSVVILLLSVIGGFAIWYIDNSIMTVLGRSAMEVAQTVALRRDVQLDLGQPRGGYTIPLVAESIRRASNVEYIVVLDMNGIQYAYSAFHKIGNRHYDAGKSQAFEGKSYITKDIGARGQLVKAFTPIYRDGQQVGIVIVGIMFPPITNFLTELESGFYYILLGGFLLTILSSTYVARNIKKQILGLEPEEIAKRLTERDIIMQTVKEGILAVDKNYKITIVNGEGQKILGVKEDIIGEDIRNIDHKTHIPEIIESGSPEYDREHILENRKAIVANTLPINVRGEVVGAVSSFRDLTEVKNLAEQLTGVTKFIDALRAQNHEFLNKMHTISGLLQLKCYDEALSYIDDISEVHEEMLGFLIKNIKDATISGLLLAKYNKMQELKIRFTMDPSSKLENLDDSIDTNILVTIIGNLLENSIDAVWGLESDRRSISLTLLDNDDELEIIVTDTGEGISEENYDNIYKFGFSTKMGDNKGIGLALVKQFVDDLNGTIEVESQVDFGTEVIINIPKKVGRGFYERNFCSNS